MYPLQPLVRFPGLQFFLKRSLTLLFPLGYPSRFLFPFLGQGTFKPNSFSGNGPTFAFIPVTLEQPESLSPASLLSWGWRWWTGMMGEL